MCAERREKEVSQVKPVHRELMVEKNPLDVRDAILAGLPALDGRVIHSEDNSIECDFGSLLQSRLIGEFWVSKSTLPKKAVIKMQAASGGTAVVLDIHDTHKFGVKWGFVKKYNEALEELCESLLSAIQ
jgi:hypothetical protein